MSDGLEQALGSVVHLGRWARPYLGRSLGKDRSALAVLGVYGVGFPAALALIGSSVGGDNPLGRAIGSVLGGAMGIAIDISIASTAIRSTRHQAKSPGTATPPPSAISRAPDSPRGHRLSDRDMGVEIFGFAILIIGCFVCWLLAAVRAVLWLPLGVQIPALTIWGLVSLHSALAIATPTARAHLVNRSFQLKIGAGAAPGFSLALAATITGWFATLTGVLAQQNLGELDPPMPTPDQLVGYYLYQALDFVNLADALPGWNPVEHHSTGIGVLTTTYRLVILTALVETWRQRRSPSAKQQTVDRTDRQRAEQPGGNADHNHAESGGADPDRPAR